MTRYGSDPAVTRVVDTYAFDITPKLNPDGMIWGTLMDWAYDQLDILSWISEVGALPAR